MGMSGAQRLRRIAECLEPHLRRAVAFCGRARRPRARSRFHRLPLALALLFAAVLGLAALKSVPLLWNYCALRHEVINVAEHSDRRSCEDLQAYLRHKALRLGFTDVDCDPEAIRVRTFYSEDGDPHCEVVVAFRHTLDLYGLRSWAVPVRIRAERIVLPRPELPRIPENLWELPERPEH